MVRDLDWEGTKRLGLIGINLRKCTFLFELIQGFAPFPLN